MFLGFFTFFIPILLIGFFVLALFFREVSFSRWEKLFYSWGIGAFIITSEIFIWLFIFRQRIDFLIFFFFVLLEIIVLFYFFKKTGGKIIFQKISFPSWRVFGSKEWLLSILIIFQISISLFNALSLPVAAFDSLAMWSFKAKGLFYANEISFDKNDFLYLGGGGHINYPWHVPLLQYWLHLNLGEYNDLAANFIFWFYYVGALALVFCFARRFFSSFLSLIFTFFISSMPLIFYHSYNSYADLVLGFYIAASFSLFYRWLDGRSLASLVLSGIFLAASFWTKDTAIFFILPFFFLFIIFSILNKIGPKPFFYFLSSFLLAASPWLFFKIIFKLGVKNVDGGIGFHPEVAASFVDAFFSFNNWNIWWFIVVFSFIINIRRITADKSLAFSWSLLILSFFSIFLIYVFTKRYLYALDNTAISRNILTMTPLSVLVLSATYGRFKKSEYEKN